MHKNKKFTDALELGDLKTLCTIPKTDLHNHAFLGARRSSIEQWTGCSVPAPGKFNSLDEMMVYFYNSFGKYLSSLEGVDFMFSSAIRDAVCDGVTLLEMSIDARIISMHPLGIDAMLEYVEHLKTSSPEIVFKPELGVSRDHDFGKIEPVAIRCIESGLFSSIDLYGNESAQPPDVYKTLYEKAKHVGMKLKAHVGEFGSAESILNTVELLELNEVQHGIAAAESDEVMRRLSDNNICLNICPTSNIMLSRVSCMQNHPVRVLYDNGIMVTVNTDDLTVFNQSVSEEYLNLFETGLFSSDELDEIRQASLLRSAAI
jgi:adenosine deaminase